MRRIQVIRGGCGIRYQDSAGHKRHMLKTSADGPFACDDAQAEGLVRMGAARYVEEETEASEKSDEEMEQGEVPDVSDASAEPDGVPEGGAETATAVKTSDSAKTSAAGSKSSAAKKTASTANKAASASKKTATATKKTTTAVKKTVAKSTAMAKKAVKAEVEETDEDEKAPVIRAADPEV